MQKAGLRVYLGYVVALMALAFTLSHIAENGGKIVQSLGDVEPWRFSVAVLASCLGLGINSLAFSASCIARGASLPARVLCGAWLATLFSKYIPIGIGHIVGRGTVLGGYGMKPRTTIEIGVFEQLVSLAWCGVIAGAAWLLGVGERVQTQAHALMVSAAIIGALLLAACLGIALLAKGRRWWVMAVAGYGFAMLPYAFAYWIVVEPTGLMKFIWTLFSGTIMGVVTFVVPGGIGVREATVSLQYPPIEGGHVLAMMVSVRGAIIASELIAMIVGQRLLNAGKRVP